MRMKSHHLSLLTFETDSVSISSPLGRRTTQLDYHFRTGPHWSALHDPYGTRARSTDTQRRHDPQSFSALLSLLDERPHGLRIQFLLFMRPDAFRTLVMQGHLHQVGRAADGGCQETDFHAGTLW